MERTCVGRLFSNESLRNADQYIEFGILGLPNKVFEHVPHHTSKLLAAWILAGVDLTPFWISVWKHANDFADCSPFDLARQQPGTGSPFLEILDHQPEMKAFFKGPKQFEETCEALYEAWKIFSPCRVKRKYQKAADQVVPTSAIAALSFQIDCPVDETLVRLEPGYQDTREVSSDLPFMSQANIFAGCGKSLHRQDRSRQPPQ